MLHKLATQTLCFYFVEAGCRGVCLNVGRAGRGEKHFVDGCGRVGGYKESV